MAAAAGALLLQGLALLALRAPGWAPGRAAGMGAGMGMGACYDGAGRPQRCLPEFENAAFGRLAEASHTCGRPPEDFCPHRGAPGGAGPPCQRCDASDPRRHHNASYLTDFHSQDDSTWWQSPSMAFGVQHPTSVTITLRLGKRGAGHRRPIRLCAPWLGCGTCRYGWRQRWGTGEPPGAGRRGIMSLT